MPTSSTRQPARLTDWSSCWRGQLYPLRTCRPARYQPQQPSAFDSQLPATDKLVLASKAAGTQRWQHVRISPRSTPKRTGRYREGFRTPLGVRKSPKNEPAGRWRSVWGFRIWAGLERSAAGGRSAMDGGRSCVRSLREHAELWGVLRPRLLSPSGHRSRAGSRGGVGGRRARACRSAPPCAQFWEVVASRRLVVRPVRAGLGSY